MKRSYYIVPVLVLGLFIFFYWQHMEEMKVRDKARQEAKAKADAEEAAKKREAQRKAVEDAEKRAREREEADRRKEADREAKRLATVNGIKTQTADINAQISKLQNEASSSEQELKTLRADRERLTRQTFDTAKKIELAQLARRTAELEVQRMAEMVARRAEESSMTRPPLAAAPTSR